MIGYLFGVIFFVLPFIFFPFTSETFEFNKIIFLYFFTILIIGAWMIRCIKYKRLIFRRTIFDIPLALFLLSQVTSTIFSIDRIISIFGYYGRFNGGLLSTTCYILLYWAFVSNISKKHSLQLIKVVLVSTFFVSTWAILEKFNYSFSCLILTGQFDSLCWAQDVSDRVFASLGQPNWLAALFVSVLPLAWIYILNPGVKKYIPHILTLLFFISILFTKSRSGLLGFGGSFVLFWVLAFTTIKKKVYLHFIVMGVYLIAAMLIFGTPWSQPIIKNDFSHIRKDDNGEIRLIVWKGALDIWKGNLLFGTGVETFAHSYYKYRPIEHNQTTEWNFVYNKAHNELLNLAANTGLFGLFSYLLIISSFVYLFIKNKTSIYVSSLLAAFIGLNITSIFGFLTVNTSLLFFVLPAFAVALTSQDKKLKVKKITITSRLFIFITIILMMFLSFQVGKIWIADIYYSRGREANQKFEFETAKDYLAKAIFLAPFFATFQDEIAQSYIGLNNINTAIVHLNKVHNLSPKNIILEKSKASAYIQISQTDQQYFPQAVDTLLQITHEAPTDPQAFYMLGLAWASVGNYENAKKYLVDAITLKPDYQKVVEALNMLGYNWPNDSKNRRHKKSEITGKIKGSN